MQITISHEQDPVPVTVFHLNGDVTSEVELQDKAKEEFNAGARNILIDLSEVPYMSSAGLRALNYIFRLYRRDTVEESDEAMKIGIAAGTFTSPHLKLLKPNKNVLEVLKTTGYDMFLEIYQEQKKALASFQSEASE